MRINNMNPLRSTKATTTFVAACVITLLLMWHSGASQSEFDTLYDYYFPKESQDVRAHYRQYFDKLLFGPPPAESDTKRESQLYYALRGDDAAFHAFLRNPDWAVEGAQGEECVYESILLLLRLGDDGFSELLGREAAKTREKVGYAIDPQIHWDKHPFPKTRSLYSYRYTRPSQ
jgi:hypothetical protein